MHSKEKEEEAKRPVKPALKGRGREKKKNRLGHCKRHTQKRGERERGRQKPFLLFRKKKKGETVIPLPPCKKRRGGRGDTKEKGHVCPEPPSEQERGEKKKRSHEAG